MKKILIIEDDQIVANIYRNKFSVEGYQVEVANDGETGMGLLHSFRPDAVILDLMLPRTTGVDFMRKVRAEPDFQQLPVIVFSNTYLTNMVQEAWKAGATKCLSKANCTPKQVLEVLRGTLGNGSPPAKTPTAGETQHKAKNGSAPLPARPAPLKPAVSDTELQADHVGNFLRGLPATLTSLRAQLKLVVKADNDPDRVKEVQELYKRVHGLTSNAAIVGLVHIAHMSDALEALLKELYEKPKSMNASTLRTVASTIDFLAILFERGDKLSKHDLSATNILVIDDEAISRRAVTQALERAKLKCQSVEDPLAAFEMLSRTKYDLVFLDVDMPGMNGFELCSKLRTLPLHKMTPVVFVTSLNDFESRANSTMSGGNDFIAKPFLFLELAVKALIYILRSKL